MKRFAYVVFVLALGSLLILAGCGNSSKGRSTGPAPPVPQKPPTSTGQKETKPTEQKTTNTTKPTTSSATTASDEKAKNFFVGKWEIWIPGSFASSENNNNDGTKSVSRSYVGGSKGKVLTIKSDYTYHWQTTGGDISGVWEEADKGRIVLLNGHLESDWYVEKTSDNEIKFYSWGMEEHGTRIKD